MLDKTNSDNHKLGCTDFLFYNWSLRTIPDPAGIFLSAIFIACQDAHHIFDHIFGHIQGILEPCIGLFLS